ncbi:MAG: hypothetical protein ACO1Q7_00605 [Gemmatimonas sp.]
MSALSNKRSRGAGVTLGQLSGTVALLTAVLLIPLSAAAAQKKGDKVRVLSGSAMRAAPGGQVVGILSRAFEGPVEMVEGNAVRLRINGFVSEGTVRLEGNRSRGVVSGKGDEGATLRTGPAEKEPSLATLMRGAVIFTGARSGGYVPANRVVWVDKSRLASFSGPQRSATRKEPAAPARPSAPKPVAPLPSRVAVADTAVPAPKPASPQPSLLPSGLPPMQLMTGSPLRVAPGGDIISTIPSGTVVTPLASENGWTRVRVEGWLPNKDLVDASAKAAGELSAAEVRADPAGTKGRTVRWTVEALSYQTGDDLRRELTGTPYLLARGPGNERAILYLAVPDSLVATARALAPLTTVTVTAKVRNGRSQPGGVPILDLVELIRR